LVNFLASLIVKEKTNYMTTSKMLLFLCLFASVIACKQPTAEEETETKVINLDDQYRQNIVDYSEYDLASLGIEDPQYFKPIEAGAIAPDFTLNDKDGAAVHLNELTKNGSVALFFYRGQWCPNCNKQLAAFVEEADRLEDAGVQLVAVTPENYEAVTQAREKTNAEFMILSDPEAEVMKQYGVAFEVTQDYQDRLKDYDVNLDATESGEVLLPVPATFVINQENKVVYTHFDPKYQNRASVDDILDALKMSEE